MDSGYEVFTPPFKCQAFATKTVTNKNYVNTFPSINVA